LFEEGEYIEGRLCPKCGKRLIYETSFFDAGTPDNHYTVDTKIICCEECGYFEDYEPEELE